jgi:hypothetical protein
MTRYNNNSPPATNTERDSSSQYPTIQHHDEGIEMAWLLVQKKKKKKKEKRNGLALFNII